MEYIKYKESDFNIKINNEESVLIYNTLTGAMVSMPNQYELSGDEKKEWVKEGLLVNKERDEFNFFVSQRQSVKWNPKPKALSFTISTTMNCQAHCEYCFEKNVVNKHTMKESVADKTSDFIIKMLKETEAKVLYLTFFGGEPTLNVLVIKKIGEKCSCFCKENDIKFSSTIVTNGILLNEKMFNDINPLINLSRIQITLDGTKALHNKVKGLDCFDKVINNICNLSFKSKVIIRLNVTRVNCKNIAELLAEMDKYEWCFDNVVVYLARVRSDYGVECNTDCMTIEEFNMFKCEMYEKFCGKILRKAQLLPAVKKTFCGWERRYNYCIGPDGLLYKCNHDIGNINKSVGNVETGNFYSQYEMQFMGSIPEDCINKKCYMVPICQGGCVMERSLCKSCNCDEIKKSIVSDLNLFYKLK